MKKTITVVIASYKYGHLAAQAIDSVLSQTRPPDQILFVDDGVGDCDHLISLYADPKVYFVMRTQNLGTVANFQDMLERVTTDYCMFLGADNYLRPDSLEVLEDRMDGADIVSYDWAIIGTERHKFNERIKSTEIENGYIIHRFTPGNIESGNYIHGSSMYDTKKAQAVGYKPSGNSRTEEDWMLFRGMIRNGAIHKHVAEPMLFYRRHKENFNPCT